jgi:hypothetical protein
MRSVWIAAVALIAGWVGPALAQNDGQVDVKPLSGDFYMAPAMNTDDPNAPVDHVFMTIKGDAAKAMWDAIKIEPTPDECVGRMARWVQSLVCYGPSTQASQPLGPDESPYECFLGLNLKTGALETGQDC